MPSTYIDAITYTRANTGLNLTAQTGNLGRIEACDADAGAIITTSPITVLLPGYDAVYIFDGGKSEILTMAAPGAAVGDTGLTLLHPTQYAHDAGTVYCSDGTSGSLGQAIFEASQTIEDICHQSLWATAYTGEKLTAPTMRAAIDNQLNLHCRPRHFPLSSLDAIAIQTTTFDTQSYDPAQAIIDADQMTIDIPLLAAVTPVSPGPGVGYPWLWNGVSRQSNMWVILGYTAGYAAGNLPQSIVRACALLTSDVFVQVSNPIGAIEIKQGKRDVKFASERDTSGQNLLYKQALNLLEPYITQVF